MSPGHEQGCWLSWLQSSWHWIPDLLFHILSWPTSTVVVLVPFHYCACSISLLNKHTSSMKSRSVKMTGGVPLDLFCMMVKPSSSSIPSVAFHSAYSPVLWWEVGASVSPCWTPAKMSNSSVLPSELTTTALVLVHMASIALRRFGGMPYAFRIFIISFQSI